MYVPKSKITVFNGKCQEYKNKVAGDITKMASDEIARKVNPQYY